MFYFLWLFLNMYFVLFFVLTITLSDLLIITHTHGFICTHVCVCVHACMCDDIRKHFIFIDQLRFTFEFDLWFLCPPGLHHVWYYGVINVSTDWWSTFNPILLSTPYSSSVSAVSRTSPFSVWFVEAVHASHPRHVPLRQIDFVFFRSSVVI